MFYQAKTSEDLSEKPWNISKSYSKFKPFSILRVPLRDNNVTSMTPHTHSQCWMEDVQPHLTNMFFHYEISQWGAHQHTSHYYIELRGSSKFSRKSLDIHTPRKNQDHRSVIITDLVFKCCIDLWLYAYSSDSLIHMFSHNAYSSQIVAVVNK